MPKRNRNHVLLLRHCVRSTGSTIKVCDGVGVDAVVAGTNGTEGNSTVVIANGTDAAKRYANFSEFMSADLPQWDVPPYQCTGECSRKALHVLLCCTKSVLILCTSSSSRYGYH